MRAVGRGKGHRRQAPAGHVGLARKEEEQLGAVRVGRGGGVAAGAGVGGEEEEAAGRGGEKEEGEQRRGRQRAQQRPPRWLHRRREDTDKGGKGTFFLFFSRVSFRAYGVVDQDVPLPLDSRLAQGKQSSLSVSPRPYDLHIQLKN